MARPKRLSAQAIEVLTSMEVTGNEARIKTGQLDRTLYQEVNEALVALGGKWNRGKKAHIFDSDPQAKIEQVVVDGEFSDESRDFSYFATPPEVASRLVDLVELHPGDRVLEPSCGEGHLVEVILTREPKVELHAFEIRESAATKVKEKFPNVKVSCKDFLQVSAQPRFKVVVANPPFALQADIDHVRHAHRFLVQGGKLVSIMAAGVTFRQDRKATSFREFVSDHGGTIEELPKSSFKSSGTHVNTVIVEIPA